MILADEKTHVHYLSMNNISIPTHPRCAAVTIHPAQPGRICIFSSTGNEATLSKCPTMFADPPLILPYQTKTPPMRAPKNTNRQRCVREVCFLRGYRRAFMPPALTRQCKDYVVVFVTNGFRQCSERFFDDCLIFHKSNMAVENKLAETSRRSAVHM